MVGGVEDAFYNRKSIGDQFLVVVIDHAHWIKRDVLIPDLKVQMWSATSACRSSQADDVARFYYLVYFNEVFRQVTVVSLQTIVMPYNDQIAKSSPVVTGIPDNAVEGTSDTVALVELYIQTFVAVSKSPEQLPIIRHRKGSFS